MNIQSVNILLLSAGVHSWSNNMLPSRIGVSNNRKSSVIRFGVESPDNLDSDNETPQEPQFGVSYIGGDPCGSKYNNDPFDEKVAKPGLPDDMKARIQALAEKKMRESAAKEEEGL